MSSALLIVAGLAGLLVGADLLVRGGAALAAQLGVRPIVIGLTVVALGTSLPELAVGIDAVRQGSPGLAVGTSLLNILFILGVSALIRPIAFERRTLRFDLPAMTGASLALWLLARDGTLTRVDGSILCLGGVAYTAGVIWTSRQESAAVQADYASHSEQSTSRGRRELLLRALTSGDRDLAVGNPLGSTVYNVAFILGITVLVAPAEIQIPHEVIAADLLILALVALLTVPVLLSGHRISRLEGGAFVATYLGYLAWLILV